MQFNKINYYDDKQHLTYEACCNIWENRGYVPKNERADPKEKERRSYRKIWADTSLFYDEDRKVFTVGWTGWTQALMQNPVNLIDLYSDGRVIAHNIVKHHFATAKQVQDNWSCWGLNRYLSRMQYLLNLKYIPRKFIYNKDNKTLKDPIVQARLSATVNFTNSKNAQDYALMSSTTATQSKILNGYSNYWTSRGGARYSEFVKSGVGQSRNEFEIIKSREQVIANYLISKYIISYIDTFVQQKSGDLLDPNTETLRDYCDVPTAKVKKKHRMGIWDGHNHEPMRINDYQLKTIGGPNETLRNNNKFTPFINSALASSVYQDRTKPSNDDYLHYTSINGCFGFGIDHWSDSEAKDIPWINTGLIRSRLKHLHVNAHANTSREYDRYSYGEKEQTGPSYTTQYNEGQDAQVEGLQNLFRHMLQTNIAVGSPMWRETFWALRFPTSILVNAALVKAGCNPDHYEFILRQYLGSSATDWLLKRPEVMFKHPVYGGFMTEGNIGKEGRNILLDYISLISGNGVLHTFANSTNVKDSCKIYAMQSAGGYRAVVDGCAYANVIPIFELNTTEPSLNDYPRKYYDRLYSMSRLFTSVTFVGKVLDHVSSQFKLEREDVASQLEWAELKQSTFKYSDLLYDYLKTLSNRPATDNICILPSALVSGHVRCIPSRTGSDDVKSYDVSLGLNLKHTFVNYMVTENVDDADVTFMKELEESMSL